MLPYSQGTADVLTRILAGEGIIVWALGCSAKCWGSQLCLEMVLQRTMLRTEFFWKLLGKGNTWGVAAVWSTVASSMQLELCLGAAGVTGCMWEQPREPSLWVILTHKKLGRAGSQTFYSFKLASAPSCLCRGRERLRFAKMGSAGTSAWHRQERGQGKAGPCANPAGRAVGKLHKQRSR